MDPLADDYSEDLTETGSLSRTISPYARERLSISSGCRIGWGVMLQSCYSAGR